MLKSILCVSLFFSLNSFAAGGDIGSGAIDFASVKSSSDVLMVAKELRLASPDHSVTLEGSKVQVQLKCTYASKSSFHGSSSKSCGQNVWNLNVPANGIVKLPTLYKFAGWYHARFASNYTAMIVVALPNGKLTSIHLDTPKGMQDFSRMKTELHIVQLEEQEFEIAIQGKPFFGSAWTKDRTATLNLIAEKQESADSGIVVRSDWDSKNGFALRSNRYANIPNLVSAVSITLPSFHYSYLPALGTKIDISAGYTFDDKWGQGINYEASSKMDLSEYYNPRVLNLMPRR